MCNPLQDSILSQSALSAGIAALRGEVEKDAHHEEAVLEEFSNSFGCEDTGALAVETLGFWSPASLRILREINIAVRTTNRNGASTTLASRHFIEQLSTCLWRNNSHIYVSAPIQFVACQPSVGAEV